VDKVSAIGTTATSRLLVRINSINWIDVGVFYGPGASRSDLPIIIPKKRDSTWHRDFEGIDEFCAMSTHISLESWD